VVEIAAFAEFRSSGVVVRVYRPRFGMCTAVGRMAGVAVPAKRGDALLMRPLVLHASSTSSGSSLRRVLHFVFGPEVPLYGLAW
jgi:hypothetical protein